MEITNSKKKKQQEPIDTIIELNQNLEETSIIEPQDKISEYEAKIGEELFDY